MPSLCFSTLLQLYIRVFKTPRPPAMRKTRHCWRNRVNHSLWIVEHSIVMFVDMYPGFSSGAEYGSRLGAVRMRTGPHGAVRESLPSVRRFFKSSSSFPDQYSCHFTQLFLTFFCAHILLDLMVHILESLAVVQGERPDILATIPRNKSVTFRVCIFMHPFSHPSVARHTSDNLEQSTQCFFDIHYGTMTPYRSDHFSFLGSCAERQNQRSFERLLNIRMYLPMSFHITQ